MNPICPIDTLFLPDRGFASIPSALETDSDNESDERDSRVDEGPGDIDFDTEVESILSSLNTEEEAEPPVDSKDSAFVDAALFLGLMKIIVDETRSEAEVKARKTKTDYEELMALSMANESEMPEVAW